MVLGTFQCREVLLTWIIVGQGPTVLVEDVCVCVCVFSFAYPSFFLPLSGRMILGSSVCKALAN